MVPKVFNNLTPRFSGMTEIYTKVYKIPPNEVNKCNMGIVEFLHNDLPPLQPSEGELVRLKTEFLKEKLKNEISSDGFLV